ncbi:hypothetical protein ACQ4PT_046774 [Festuca glaucescens]
MHRNLTDIEYILSCVRSNGSNGCLVVVAVAVSRHGLQTAWKRTKSEAACMRPEISPSTSYGSSAHIATSMAARAWRLVSELPARLHRWKMTKGFAYWFGQLDLNNPADEEDVFDNPDDGAGTSSAGDGNQQDVPGSSGAPTSEGQNVSDQPPVPSHSSVPSNSARATHSGARTGVTISSEDSGSDDEVQSTPEGFVPKTPFVGMMFDTLEAALAHYNRYAHHIGFSVKIESSRKSAIDGTKDKSVFVCNKTCRNAEVEEAPVKTRNRLITKRCECKAKLRVKRTGGRWQVTQFIEEHTHENIQKFALKKYLRSHKKIPKEEKKFIDLLHEVNLTAGRIMQIMAELYGGKANVPYDAKTQYMKLQEQIDVCEDGHAFDGDDKVVRLWGDFPMEKQIFDTYTLPLYNRYQIEMRKITSYNCRDLGGGVYEIFPVQNYVYGYGSRSYLVHVFPETEIYNCVCCKFDKDGILCCHVMKVMSYIGAVTRIPDHYLLHRWCLPPPDIVAPVVEPTPKPTTKMSRKNMRLLRYGNLCNEFSRRAVALAASEHTKEIAEKHMLGMDRDLAELRKANAAALKRKKRKKNAECSTDAGDDGGSQTMEEGAGPTIQQSDLSANRKAKDPP